MVSSMEARMGNPPQETHYTFTGEQEFEFRIWLQENGPLRLAEEMLATGSVECICD